MCIRCVDIVKTRGSFPPGDEEAALESEEQLRLRLLARSGADTLAEVGLVTDIDSTFSWVFMAAFFWLQERGKRNKRTCNVRDMNLTQTQHISINRL